MRGRRRLAHAASRFFVNDAPVRVSSYGVLFEVDLRDHVEEQIFWEDYDRHVMTWWRDVMTTNVVFIDVGANVGLYSLVAAARGAKVVAFEPNPRTRARFEANVRLNGLVDRITIRDEALSDTIGEAHLFEDANLGQTSSNAGVASLSNRNAGGASVPVHTSTLDAVVDELNLPHVDWIKLDIQGAELAALRGADRTLSMKPKLVIEVEPNAAANMGWSPADLRSLLQQKGYRLRDLDSMNVLAEPA